MKHRMRFFSAYYQFRALLRVKRHMAAISFWGTAERFLRQSVALDPSAFFVHIELGNVYLKQGSP